MAILKILGSSSKGNCYLLETEKETLMLDCGVAYRNINKAVDKGKTLVGCLLSHIHQDHLKAYKKLLSNGISIYTSKAIKDEIQKDNEGINTFKQADSKYKLFKLGGFMILPFENHHTNNDGTECPCVGYLIYHADIGKVLFATDTYKLDYKFNDVDHILIECNYAESIIAEKDDAQERVIRSHMSLENLKEYLKSWNLDNTKDITLLHLSERNGDKERFKREVEELTGKTTNIAEKGVVLEW